MGPEPSSPVHAHSTMKISTGYCKVETSSFDSAYWSNQLQSLGFVTQNSRDMSDLLRLAFELRLKAFDPSQNVSKSSGYDPADLTHYAQR
jgi:hypothetical protein